MNRIYKINIRISNIQRENETQNVVFIMSLSLLK